MLISTTCTCSSSAWSYWPIKLYAKRAIFILLRISSCSWPRVFFLISVAVFDKFSVVVTLLSLHVHHAVMVMRPILSISRLLSALTQLRNLHAEWVLDTVPVFKLSSWECERKTRIVILYPPFELPVCLWLRSRGQWHQRMHLEGSIRNDRNKCITSWFLHFIFKSVLLGVFELSRWRPILNIVCCMLLYSC